MNPAIRNSLGVAACIALVCLSVCLVCIANAAISADDTATAATAAIVATNTTIADLDKQLAGKYGLINELTSAARESRKTIDVLQQTSLAERAKVAAFSDASIQAVNDLDAVARNGATAIQGLQGEVANLGRLATSLKGDSDAAGQTIAGATALLSTLDKGAGQALGSMNVAVGHVDALVASTSPAVQHLDHLSGELDDGGKSLAETLGFIRDDFKPAKKSFWTHLLDTATGGMFSVVLHWLPQRVEVVNK